MLRVKDNRVTGYQGRRLCQGFSLLVRWAFCNSSWAKLKEASCSWFHEGLNYSIRPSSGTRALQTHAVGKASPGCTSDRLLRFYKWFRGLGFGGLNPEPEVPVLPGTVTLVASAMLFLLLDLHPTRLHFSDEP